LDDSPLRRGRHKLTLTGSVWEEYVLLEAPTDVSVAIQGIRIVCPNLNRILPFLSANSQRINGGIRRSVGRRHSPWCPFDFRVCLFFFSFALLLVPAELKIPEIFEVRCGPSQFQVLQ